MSGSQHTLVYNFLCAANYDNFSKGEREIDAQNERKRKNIDSSLSLSLSFPLSFSTYSSLSFPSLFRSQFFSPCVCVTLSR